MDKGRTTHRKTTRKQFLVEVAGMASAAPALAAQTGSDGPNPRACFRRKPASIRSKTSGSLRRTRKTARKRQMICSIR